MKKKGVTVQSTLIILIILIISAALLFFILGGIPFQSTSSKEACRQSVLMRSRSILGTHPTQGFYPLNCETEKIEISTRNEEIIKRDIANTMYDCWSILGEGKLDFFSESEWRDIGFFGTSKARCVICARINFDKSLKSKPEEFDILRYFDETKVPDKNYTYMEYFSERAGTHLTPEVRVDELTKTDQDLAVVYMAVKGDNFGQMMKREGLIVGGLLFGGAGLSKVFTGSFGTLGKMFFRKTTTNIPTPTPSPNPGTAEVVEEMGEYYGFKEANVGVQTASSEASKTTLTKGAKASIWIGVAILATITAGQLYTLFSSTHAAAVHCEGDSNGCQAILLVPYNASVLSNTCEEIGSIP